MQCGLYCPSPQIDSSSVHGSAETQPRRPAVAMSTAPSLPTDSTPTDDSAETPAQESVPACGTASTPPCVQLESTPADDSAEAEEAPGCHLGGPAEWRDGKSLLEELLDEAELPRAAEAVPATDDASAPTEVRSGGQASVLHQQADAARRAFNRADALVSLAQGYLRGDRPNRAPIEVFEGTWSWPVCLNVCRTHS